MLPERCCECLHLYRVRRWLFMSTLPCQHPERADGMKIVAAKNAPDAHCPLRKQTPMDPD